MHIAQIDTGYLPPLERATFDCDKQVNLFIGPNASGKSTILRAIKGVHSLASSGGPPPPRDGDHGDPGRITNVPAGEDSVGDLYLNYDSVIEGEPLFALKASDDWPRDDSGTIWGAVPSLHIPATRISLPGMHIFGQTIEEPEDVNSDAPLERLFDTESGVFDGRYVELAIDRLRNNETHNRNQLRRALQLGYSCAKRICSEVIYDDSPHSYVESQRGVFGAEEIVRMHYNMGIVTSDDILGEPLYAGALSSGTQGTLLWVYALALRMVSHYGWTEGWEKKPAILLIDEIENHLHPTWQRRVIRALLEHFPGLQVFATTHSPFVVAGLKAGQVHLLERDEYGVVTATTKMEDVVGWTADEILRNMMGVDDPTDNETAEAARELRQLRNEEPRSAPEEEEARQRRIQELRQLVDRDLLAGGPWKKQRELFEQQFAEALQKYRQSQGLNQENG